MADIQKDIDNFPKLKDKKITATSYNDGIVRVSVEGFANRYSSPINNEDWGYLICCGPVDELIVLNKMLTDREDVKYVDWYVPGTE